MQLASSFMSKILPGGLGGGGLNTKYLTRSGMDISESAAVLATQNVIGLVLFILPLALFLLLNGKGLTDLVHINIQAKYIIGGLVALAALVGVLALFKKLRLVVVNGLTSFIQGLRSISTPSRELGIACLASFAVTISYIVCLYAAFKAFGLPLGISAAILVYASAVIAKSAIPTPGGLGPLEAAMIAAMIGLGINKDQAFSAVLLYRLATFWLPIPFSLIAYKYINAKRII